MKPQTFTLGEAAKHTGKSKATISKALKSGKLSYRAKTAAGYEIDPAELARVYPETASEPLSANDRQPQSEPLSANDRQPQSEQANTTGEPSAEALRAEVAALREMVAMLKEDKADWKAQAERLAIAKSEPTRRSWFGLRRGRAA